MEKLIFNAQLTNSKRFIKALSGRVGSFVFRTYPNGLITAYYKPAKNRALTGDCREKYEILSREIREIADQLRLNVSKITYDIK